MNETLQLIPTGEALADWCGKQVKVKGLIGGSPELLMVGRLVGVCAVGAVLACKNRRTFLPWTTIFSMSLVEEGASERTIASALGYNLSATRGLLALVKLEESKAVGRGEGDR